MFMFPPASTLRGWCCSLNPLGLSPSYFFYWPAVVAEWDYDHNSNLIRVSSDIPKNTWKRILQPANHLLIEKYKWLGWPRTSRLIIFFNVYKNNLIIWGRHFFLSVNMDLAHGLRANSVLLWRIKKTDFFKVAQYCTSIVHLPIGWSKINSVHW